MEANPYHAGELEIQRQLGGQAQAAALGRSIQSIVPDGVAAFLAEREYVVLSGIDARGRLWSSFVPRNPGSIQIGDGGQALFLRLSGLETAREQDPLLSALGAGANLGCLFIDLATRRRYRINGRIEHIDAVAMKVRVDQAFGNCPKYIQKRSLRGDPTAMDESVALARGRVLGVNERALIENTDTCFVASASGKGDCDASHRGGRPGFIRVMNENTLRIPDYAGNNMYLTLGNLQDHPRAGLTCIDFENRTQLQMTGRTRLELNTEDVAGTGGTGRWWNFEIEQWVRTGIGTGARWELAESSPFNP